MFLFVSGCPIDICSCLVASVVVGGCRLQKSSFVSGLFLLVQVVVRCFGCFVLFKVVFGLFRIIWLIKIGQVVSFSEEKCFRLFFVSLVL